ncbi:hypothetical protein BJF78_10825 [Pseudonocardia sp. CNS-139]|nr:hypothetical protein BJF78_10825 [Pseudonocardia sp. CNS-139]
MDVIDLARLEAVCGRDWGWYTTVTDNLPRVLALAEELLPRPAAARVAERITSVTDVLAACPKPLRWRARAKVGRRMPWYELPEEIGGAIGG